MEYYFISQSTSENLTFSLINELNNHLHWGDSDVAGIVKSHRTDFKNGELTVVLDESVRNKSVIIVSRATKYDEMFELLSTIDAARRSSAKEIIAIVPCLPHSRQERRNGSRTSISARLFADMLQVAGLDRLITMDVHTTAIEGFYKIPFDNLDPIHQFCGEIKGMNLHEPILVSPDFGGMKRVKKYADTLAYDMTFINKERQKANEVAAMTLLGDVEGRDVLLLDDMIDTGNTLMKAASLLKEKGAQKVYAMATHGILSGDAIQKMIVSDLDKVFVGNTLDKVGGRVYQINLDRTIIKYLEKIFE